MDFEFESLPVIHLETVDSTNAYLKKALLAGEQSTAIVWSKEQTAGRGRLGRHWKSPVGGLYFSVAAPCSSFSPIYFSLLLSVSVSFCLRKEGLDAWLKWPNDIVVPDALGQEIPRKLGGILAEFLPIQGKQAHVIAGVGLNINTEISLEQKDFPDAQQPTSFLQIMGRELDVEVFAERLALRFTELYRALSSPRESFGQKALLELWKKSAWTLEQKVRVILPDQSERIGKAIDVTDEFALLLQGNEGKIEEIQTGDCFHLRQDV